MAAIRMTTGIDITSLTRCSRGRLTTLLLPLLLAGLLGPAGCQSQRPIHVIRADADREYEFDKYEAAASGYAEIVERRGGDWEAQYKLGLCSMELDRLPQARTALEIAASLRPKDDRITEALAETMFLQGDERHLFAYLKDHAERTGTGEAWLRLARYATAIGDADWAKLAIETAIVLDDGQAVEPYLEAAEFAEKVGDLDLAVRRLRQAYAIDPRDGRVSERLMAMGEIPGPSIALPPGR